MRKLMVFLVGALALLVLWSCSFRINHKPGDVELIKPGNGDVVSRFPTFVWKASDPDIDDKLEWNLHIIPSGGKDYLLATGTMNPDSEASWTVPKKKPLNKGNFEWYVLVKDIDGTTNQSKKISFSTKDMPPQVTLVSPVGDRMSTHRVTFKWNMSDPENDNISAKLYVSTSASKVEKMSDDALMYNGTNPSTTLTLESGKTYYWKIFVEDKYGATDVSNTASFMTGNQPPQVTLVSPVGDRMSTHRVTFKWNMSDPENDNISAKLYVSTSASKVEKMSDDALMYNGTNPSTTLTLESGKTYYWKIFVEDKYGATDVSNTASFMTGNQPPQVTLLKPTTGSSVTASPTLEWSVEDEDDATLTSYLYLSMNPNLVENESISALATTVITSGPSTVKYEALDLKAGVYYWKVKVTDCSTSVTKESTFLVEK